jgi:hypothetical protein
LDGQNNSNSKSNFIGNYFDDFRKTFHHDFKIREMLEKFTPESEKTKIEIEKLTSIQRWYIFLTVMWFAYLITGIFDNNIPLPLWKLLSSAILSSIMMFCILYSKFRNINAIYIGMITL